ncbi:Gfo/Idh/MocA family oxidoreductase [Alicyclobacillus mali]|uniref:Inositol 2-dehydrogenase/D-chiro-inositol 3-dehydrogenase n=1 Tax=Alicyclobacillus mali (ex Roth et al. 2021) TaxID=1123961 RepID=A0ABS0F0Q0_9BACL|nr:Gfo/Idh/MocA family oxidoreductase [Alicyclobacillus mali (ex Roth et al. 2021)]MBF8376847.1 Gfo/Idh/MocA family oxidoreductase [Alicyclobacillus mali (ex Roth et al. 2021)]
MTVRFGVIGTGAIGQEHIRRVEKRLSGGKVVAVTDISLDAARHCIEALELDAQLCDSEDEILQDSSVDAVIVTSWGPAHEGSVLKAIAAGKYVFVEKPLATTVDGCLRIVEAEARMGKRLVQVGFMRRYDASYVTLKREIESGRYGAPLMVRCVHRNACVDHRYTTDMAVLDTLIHELDVTRWLLGDDYTCVQVLYPKTTRHAPSGLQDPQIFNLVTQSGVVITAEVFVNCQYGYDIQCEVVCEDGVVSLASPQAVDIRHAGLHAQPVMQDWRFRFSDAYDAELQDFIDHVARGAEPSGPSSFDGYVATMVGQACVSAQGRDEWVTISVQKDLTIGFIRNNGNQRE